MQQPKITNITDKNLIGLSIHTSLAENKTFELWSTFKPRVKEINNRINKGFYSIQVYENNFDIRQFTPNTYFKKWAATEVSDFDTTPKGLQPFTLPGGYYAIFIHKGTPQQFPKTASFIYEEWLPNSDYELDNRPHFEYIPEHNKPNDPNAKEEVWIPIKLKVSK